MTGEGGATGGAAGGAPPTPPGILPAEILGDSLDATLARTRQTEREQYRVWRAAVQANDLSGQSVALRNYRDAQKNLIDIEQQVFAAKKDRGLYVSLPEAQLRIDARLGQLRAALATFPRKLATEIAPADAARMQARVAKLQVDHFNAPIEAATKALVDASEAAAAPLSGPPPAADNVSTAA